MSFTPYSNTIQGANTGVCGFNPSFNSLPRYIISGSVGSLASGVGSFDTIEVPPNYPLTRLGFMTGGTAAITPAHWWLALVYPVTGLVIAQTADQLTNPIGAFSINDLPMITPVNAPINNSYLTPLWVALMVNAATVPTTEGNSNTGAATTNPAAAGTFGSGLTTPPAIGSAIGTISAPTARMLVWAR